VETETRGRNLSLTRFTAPEPSRRIGLVWRKTSPRKRDFKAFSAAVKEALKPKRK